MNKILVKIYIPTLEAEYDLWIPQNKKIYNVISLILKGAKELCKIKEQEPEQELPILYNKLTGEYYDINKIVSETDIDNGTELILI